MPNPFCGIFTHASGWAILFQKVYRFLWQMCQPGQVIGAQALETLNHHLLLPEIRPNMKKQTALRHSVCSGVGFQRQQVPRWCQPQRWLHATTRCVWVSNAQLIKTARGSWCWFWNYRSDGGMVLLSVTRELELDKNRPMATEHTVHKVSFTVSLLNIA